METCSISLIFNNMCLKIVISLCESITITVYIILQDKLQLHINRESRQQDVDLAKRTHFND